MNLSKSKYCNAIQCKKMSWLDENKPNVKEETTKDSILDNGTDVGIIAKNLFNPRIDIEFNENLNIMIENTKRALENTNIVVTEGSFNYENNFCSIDILKKNDNTYEIYEVKSSTEIKDVFIDDISYQYYIMVKLGYNVKKCYLVYINNNYVRKGELELNKLFNIKDVTPKVLEKQNEVVKNINDINEYMKQKDEPNERLDLHCTKPYDCPFFKYCTKHLPENNVFNIRSMPSKTKFKLYNKGVYKYEDLLNEDIKDKYKQQIDFELNTRETYINKENIKEFLNELSYPIYFLDFETFQQPIPEYDSVKPYEQIPFQYSLHYIENENGELFHKEFLAEDSFDPRRTLAESLIKDIPKNVCVTAYNMNFEKMVIKNLSKLYPDLSDHLMNIYDNMHDLMIPFVNRDYYTKAMKGSYSIKYVLPALFPNDPKLDYHNLEMIHNGSEAMSEFANLKNLEKNDKEKVRYNLLRYCELDTYAMVKIWQKLNEVIK